MYKLHKWLKHACNNKPKPTNDTQATPANDKHLIYFLNKNLFKNLSSLIFQLAPFLLELS